MVNPVVTYTLASYNKLKRQRPRVLHSQCARLSAVAYLRSWELTLPLNRLTNPLPAVIASIEGHTRSGEGNEVTTRLYLPMARVND
ncbi:hypothetical protein EVAR_72086_1 [Eumeta japonica]|uniref:Uncharacterized protein n=1 Tax=Eumeta variegata TaxID=151549 RepID=A0A4C1SCS9_EUMVA|nr:hypothetical protein EVAR_72086_1 [Eumeta japonica]